MNFVRFIFSGYAKDLKTHDTHTYIHPPPPISLSEHTLQSSHFSILFPSPPPLFLLSHFFLISPDLFFCFLISLFQFSPLSLFPFSHPSIFFFFLFKFPPPLSYLFLPLPPHPSVFISLISLSNLSPPFLFPHFLFLYFNLLFLLLLHPCFSS